VEYYVKPDFSTSFKGSLQLLEQQVEEDHVYQLKANCLNEKSYRELFLLVYFSIIPSSFPGVLASEG